MKYLLLLSLFSFSAMTFANSPLPNHRHIAVVGTAELEAKPDIAVVSFSLHSEQNSSQAAKKDVDDRVNLFLDGLDKFDIDEDNVSASSISTQPVYTYAKGNKRQVDGYSANRELKVTLNDITRLSDLMDFALSVKINSIGNINMKSSKETALKDEVNALAVKNAKEKGKSFAKAFDAKLGNIYSINLNSSNNMARFGRNRATEMITVSGMKLNESGSKGQYLQENIVFSASVSVVFDLEVFEFN